jgi:hypothetical protein
MALRDFWGFDHLLSGNNPPAGDRIKGGGLAYNGYGLSTDPGNSGSGTRASYIDAGWIIFDSNDGNRAFRWRIRWSAGTKTDGVSDKSHFGCTYKRTNSLQGRAEFPIGTALLWLGNTVLLTHSDFPNTLDRLFKFEVTVDRVAKTVGVYVDGQLKKLLTTPGLADSYSGDTQIYFGHPVSLTYTGFMSFRDFYFVDDTKDDSVCNRLLSGSVVPLPLKTVTGAEWTTTAASLLASLNTPLIPSNVVTLVPVVNSSATITDLEYTVTAPSVPGARIRGVSVLSNIAKFPMTATSVVCKFSSVSGSTSLGNTVLPQTSLMFSKPIGMFSKLADGSELTTSVINSGKFSLTPQGV